MAFDRTRFSRSSSPLSSLSGKLQEETHPSYGRSQENNEKTRKGEYEKTKKRENEKNGFYRGELCIPFRCHGSSFWANRLTTTS